MRQTSKKQLTEKILQLKANGLMLLVSVLVFTGCSHGQNQENESAQLKVPLLITSPEEIAEKRIVKVETFLTSTCFYDRSLTSEHPDYAGVMLYSEQQSGSEISYHTQITANQPMTIKASLSKILAEEKSSICYFQPVSFTPKHNKTYQLMLTSLCEITIYENDKVDSSNVRLIDIDSENKGC